MCEEARVPALSDSSKNDDNQRGRSKNRSRAKSKILQNCPICPIKQEAEAIYVTGLTTEMETAPQEVRVVED